MSAVIVTGASGFIGARLVRSLRSAGYAVTALGHGHNDVTEPKYWHSLPSVDHVIHLAARTYVPASWHAPAEFISTNVTGTVRATEYCRTARAHLVFVSAYIYGVPQRLPVDEDHAVSPNNPYALSKVLAEGVCRFHAETEHLPVTIVRPFNIFGPAQRGEFLVATILGQILRASAIRVKDLSPRRDFLFVDDLVAGLVMTLEKPIGTRVFNFGSGISYSVREVVDLAQAAANTSLRVFCDDAHRLNEIPDVRADISRARSQLGWSPGHSLIEGLKVTLESLRSDQGGSTGRG
jgi:nucleoside-diphosphate-sugar epimerase